MHRTTSIISAYYCEPWITGRVQNLLEQTEVPNIVAVCQNGSEEQKLLSKFPQVLVLTTPDIPTVYEAWNMALDAVTTPYVNIANSDDRLTVTGIQEMCDALEKNPDVGLAYPDCHVVYELNGDVTGAYEWAEGDLFNGCYVGPCPVYRSELHKLYGKFPSEYVVAGDYWMWLNFQHNGVKFLHIKKPLCRFWDRSKDPSIENNVEFKYSARAVWETAKAKEYWKCQ